MTNHKLSAIDLSICVDTLYHSLCFSNWNGSITNDARRRVLEKLENIMFDMNVEIITEKPSFTIDADTGL